jgi:microcin C transport system substrate-binding protein
MRHHIRYTAILSLLLSLASLADTTYPTRDWNDTPDPLASPYAYRGGTIRIFAGQYPKSFNYYLDNNTFCAELAGLMYDSLLGLNPLTATFEPALAATWTISEDQRTFTFSIDPDARWSDGTPISAQDVVWTYDTILDKNSDTGPHKIALQRFERPEALDGKTVRFQAREIHWRNLLNAGSFHILPKHAFEKIPFNEINFDFPVVSGPYAFGTLKEGVSLELVRRQNWWKEPQVRMRGVYNFDTILYRFYAERGNAFDAFKKDQFDLYAVHTSRLWVKETQGDPFVRNWIVRQRIQNYNPIGFQGFALNMRRPPYDDLNVRTALAHLLNRDLMNSTLMYNQYFLHKSYHEDLYSPETPCENPSYDYNPARAATLLADAGWVINPETQQLEKEGRPFVLTFLTRDPSSEKFLQIYEKDLARAGIKLVINRKDWAGWSRDMNSYDFDVTWAAWGASLFKDPESLWHSHEADREGGNNITGFADPTVDSLIASLKTEFDLQTRNAQIRRIDGIITRQCPYLLLWNLNYSRLLYWNRFGTPPTVLAKFGDASSALAYWWYDDDLAADLDAARSAGTPLPPAPESVVFDDAFEPPATQNP